MRYGWRRYVPVAQRRAKAARALQKLRKQGAVIEPVEVGGRKISKSFWGKAWCEHLESFSDYENRLPRGRTYVRNGSVCHLVIEAGRVSAIVSGSSLYDVSVDIAPLRSKAWKSVKQRCTGQIGSLLELLQGRLSDSVMEVVADRDGGLFPRPKEIGLHCSCPDWAEMCKHVAATLYGVGARLDTKPELLFLLRQVDPEELIATAPDLGPKARGKGKGRRLAGGDLSEIFGVELSATPAPPTKVRRARKTSRRRTPRKSRKVQPIETPAKETLAESEEGFVPTAASVARMRRRFDMSRAEFAQLLAVSPGSVARWESAGEGRLSLQPLSEESLFLAVDLTREEAWDVIRS